MPEYSHVESILVVPDKVEILNHQDWQIIGGPTLNFELFEGSPSSFFSWIGGSYYTDWCKLGIRVVERRPDETIMDLMAIPVILPNLSNTRGPLGIPSSIPPTSSGNVYQIEAKIMEPDNTKLYSAYLSNLTLTLLRWE